MKGQVAADRLRRWGFARGQVSHGVTEWEMGPRAGEVLHAKLAPQVGAGGWPSRRGEAGGPPGAQAALGCAWALAHCTVPAKSPSPLGRTVPAHSRDSGGCLPARAARWHGVGPVTRRGRQGTVKTQALLGT